MAEHTAIPFRVKKASFGYMITSDERTVAQVFYPQGIHSFAEADKREEADARFIVTACNNFEEMVKALKHAQIVLLQTGDIEDYTTKTLTDIAVVLSKLEGAQ